MLPFPRAVGFSTELSWKLSLRWPPQLQGFLPPMRIDNFCLVGSKTLVICPLVEFPFDLYGFYDAFLKPASRLAPLMALWIPSPKSGAHTCSLESLLKALLNSMLPQNLPFWPLCPLISWLFKKLSALVPDPPRGALLTMSPLCLFRRFKLIQSFFLTAIKR